ncbi:MAG: FlgD immunoglobulin-like domain containing protein, partial [candidate division Zixibacteria bacterium]|nr:FlgD immunoglobulin-like domain containing protein [candidate division Zixibacteria bacterium]
VTPTSSNIDFTLTQSEEGFLNVGGMVTLEGEPIRNASVYAYSESGKVVASAVSSSEGEYIIEKLLPGSYFLLTTSPDGGQSGPQVELKFKSFCGVDINIGRSDVGKDKNRLPEKVSLSQNYPNPFNPSTTIPFTVYGSQFIVHSPIPTTLIIYNLTGQKVRTLVNDKMMPGNYQVIWDGENDKGNKVSSGAYFYRFKAGENFETKKMIMLK